MGGSDTTQDTTSQSVQQLPPWINDAAQQNYAFAQNVAEQPLQQYQGQMIADVSPQMQQAWNTAATGGSAGQDQYNASQAGYLGVLGQAAPQAATAPWVAPAYGTLAAPVTAAQANTAQAAAAQQAALAAATKASKANLSQLSNTNLQPYMNPYTQNVIDKTLPIMQQSLAQQQNAIQNQANSANAFGGSRQAINQGVLGAQGAQGMGQMAAQLNQANFQQAQQAGEFDVSAANNMGQFNANQLNQVGMYNQGQANQANQFNAGQGNQVNVANAQMANAANQFNAGQTNQTNLADMAAANAMSQFNAGAANNMRQFDTGQINSMNQFNAGAQLQQENLANTAAAGMGTLGDQAQLSQARNFTEQMTAGQMEQQQAQNQINAQMAKFQNAANYPNQQLSVLQSALGMTPYEQGTQSASTTQTQQSADPLSTALSAAKTLGSVASMFPASDRRLKTDITKVGTHPSGIAIHAYRYKGDPKTYPKVVGPMAEDVAKKFGPGAVAKIPGSGGKMAVHPAIMGALAVPRGPAMGPPVSAMSMGGPRMPGPNLAAIAGARPPMGAMAPPVAANSMGGPRMPGPNLAAIASGGMGPLAGPRMMRSRPMRMPRLKGALAGG